MKRMLSISLVVAAVGCGGGGWPHVVNVKEISAASGGPSVSRVVDLGDIPQMPAEGQALPKDGGDGTFVVGEFVLISGGDFGKLPTVLIGGRPMEVIARTSDGGLVSRIPPGVAAGKVTVEVSNPSGRGVKEIDVHRYGLVTQGDADRVHVIDVTANDASVAGLAAAVDAPRGVRTSADGMLAFVASAAKQDPAKGGLSVLALASPHGPKVVFDIATGVPNPLALAVAESAPVLAVVGDRTAQLFLLSEQRHPSPYETFTLPDEIANAGVVSADLTPDGTILLILVAEGNKLYAYDIDTPEKPTIVATLEILPGERLPLAADVRVSSDGKYAWVLTGDSAKSVAAGKQPTRLVTVSIGAGDERLGPGAKAFRITHTADVVGATAPVRLAIARNAAEAAGTAIRDTAAEIAIFVTGVNAALLGLGADPAKSADVLKTIAEPGTLVRSDVDGKGGPMFTAPAFLSAAELSPDSQVLVVSGCTATVGEGGVTVDFGVTVTALASPKPKWIKLAGMSPAALHPPFAIGSVGIQP